MATAVNGVEEASIIDGLIRPATNRKVRTDANVIYITISQPVWLK
jgi:hypothetical protein